MESPRDIHSKSLQPHSYPPEFQEQTQQSEDWAMLQKHPAVELRLNPDCLRLDAEFHAIPPDSWEAGWAALKLQMN